MVITVALWGWAPPPPDDQGRLEPGVSPFPTFGAGSNLHVVTVGMETNHSTRMTLLSLQGLVNRDHVELYIDFQDELSSASPMLGYLVERYNLTYDLVDVSWVLAQYLPRASGLFVYDPGRPESINIGTTYAGIEAWVLVGPDNAATLSELYGLPVRLDYAKSDWAVLSPTEAYERALRDLYPRSYDRLLAILPPEASAIRDYLIATKTFVFYYPQGALASSPDISATLRVLRATPRGIPVIGWFRNPTMTEENAFIQLLSGEGKYFVGVQDVPNLTVLSAYGRGQPYTQNSLPPTPQPIENKVYTVVAISDGDNLDFAAGRMMKIWESPVRGDFPVAWTVSPYFVELAPPYIDYYYGTATPQDSFVAGPSGVAYIYPDFLREGDLEPFLETTAEYMQAADLDVVWLLNSFPAYETPYRAESLAKYAEVLGPRGLVLDYADQATSQASWIVEGGGQAAPVVRSTHFWTTRENFLGKLQATMEAWDEGPQFLWMAVYPFTHNLTDAKEMIDVLQRQSHREIEIVSAATFFDLLLEDFQGRALDRLESLKGDPFASLIASSLLESAERHLIASEELSEEGYGLAAYEAYLASRDLGAAARWEATILSALILAVISGVALALGRRARLLGDRARRMGPPALTIVAATALFMLALRSALDLNFWTYYSVAVGVVVSGFAFPLRDLIAKALPRRWMLVSSLVMAAGTATTLFIPAAFPIAMLGAVAVISSAVGKGGPSPYLLLPVLAVGVAIGFLVTPDIVTFSILAIVLVAPTVFWPSRQAASRDPGKSKGVWTAGLAAALPIASLAPYHTLSLAIRLELSGPDLAALGSSLLILGPLAAMAPAWFLRDRRQGVAQLAAFALIVTFTALLFLSQTTLTATLALFGLVTSLSLLAFATVGRYLAGGGSLSSLVRPFLVFVSTLLLLLRIPPVTYTLPGLSLPQWMEYSLYAPQVIFVALAGVALLPLLFLSKRAKGTEPVTAK